MRTNLATCALLLASFATCGQAQQEDRPDPRHVRVIWTTAPQTTATVSWSTRALDDGHHVVVGLDPESVTARRDVRRIDAHSSAPFHDDEDDDDVAPLVCHHARLTDLEPSTTYWFVVVSGGRQGPLRHFRTAPADDRPFAFLSGGDSRTDREDRRKMNRRIAAIAAARDDVIAFAHGGDCVTNGLVLAQWQDWLDDHELTVPDSGRLLPLIPTRGNHEARGPLYDQVFDHPGGPGAVNWYETSLGRDVLLITLNSETAADGDQREFLEAVLERNRERRFKLVQYHRPLFPAVKTPGRAKSHWQPLFDAHRIDLALESDGHVLKRTVPIRGDEPDADGVVYIGEGGLGVAQRKPQGDRWYLEPPGMATSAHHVWIVAVTPEALALEAVGVDGDVLDRALIPARQR